MIFSSSIQTLLSVPESHQFNPSVTKESRTIPPIGNFTLPRRKLFQFSIAKIQQSQINLVATFYVFKFLIIDEFKITISHHLNQGFGIRQTPPISTIYRQLHIQK
jgi:hypothetical protein